MSIVPFTNTGRSLKCYAPWRLAGGRDGSGNITIQWERRARVNNDWLNGIDVPLDEPTESYLVTLYNFTFPLTINTQLTVLVPTLALSTAEQTTYFGAPVGPHQFYVGVQQIGSLGPGYEAQYLF